MSPKEPIERLEYLLSEIEIQYHYKRIGIYLSPAIIGIILIRRANKRIKRLVSEKGQILKDVKRYVSQRAEKATMIYQEIKKNDTYLIYSIRQKLKEYLKKYLTEVSFLMNYRDSFDEEFNSFVEESYEKIQTIAEKVNNFNSEFVKRRKKEYDYLFKKSPFSLDDDQKTAIITDDKHNLVVAGAGSGKTEVLTTRIAYLINRKPDTIRPERILALTFQNKAAKEMSDRLRERYAIDNIEVRTFHSLGKKIIEDAAKHMGKPIPRLKFSGDNLKLEYNKFISSILKKAQKDPKVQNEIINLMKSYGDNEVMKSSADFKTKEEEYKYWRNLRYSTLNGYKVKSEAEREIMNFFVTHNLNGKKINILYESPAEWMKYTNDKGEHVPRPDFFLPEYDIYIEHWAIGENGKVPEWFEGDDPTEEYMKNMHIKIRKFDEHEKYSLIETNHTGFKSGYFLQLLEKKLIDKLQNKYPGQEFKFSPISYEELVERVWYECRESVKRLYSYIASFITIAKTYRLTPIDIEKRLSGKKWSPKQHAFAMIAKRIYKIYEKELRSSNQIDFSDMINRAADELKARDSLYKNVFDHILIDEYQDISNQRYQLIKRLMEKNERCKLFCVGDDWQSIMGFAGSDIDLFVKFNEYFDHPARTNLGINYRSNKSIVDTGAEIIKHNGDAQLEKKAIAKNNIIRPVKVISSLHKEDFVQNYYNDIAEHCIDKIIEYKKNGYDFGDMMLLCRIKKNRMMINSLKEHAEKKGMPITENLGWFGGVPLLSVHASKGLQSKIVFLLNMNSGTYGFPCELENPDIFEPAIKGRKKDREEEERRLFYVAITRAMEDVIIYSQKCSESKFLNEIREHIDVEELSYNKTDNMSESNNETRENARVIYV